MSLLLAAVVWGLSLIWPLHGANIENKDLWSNASTLVQAILGTALVGASAFVAIMIATSATKTADSALHESKTNNQINDPDYLGAKQALRGYQRYAFQVGSLLATYRLHKQQSQLRQYAQHGVTKESGDPGAKDVSAVPVGPGPAWNETLRQLQQLLFDESFVSAAYEAARLLDDSEADDRPGETHVQALRKDMAGLSSVIEQILADQRVADSTGALMNLLARSALLVHQLELGCVGMTRFALSANDSTSTASDSSNYPMLRWLSGWVGQIPAFETDRSFRDFLRIPFGEFFLFGMPQISNEVPRVIDEILSGVMPSKLGHMRDACGLHRALLVATTVGDQATLLGLESVVGKVARKQGLEPMHVHVTDPNGVPRFGAERDNGKFLIFTCTRKTLPFLFRDAVFGPYTKGCVIVDGVRASDPLCLMEDSFQERSTWVSKQHSDDDVAPDAFVPDIADVVRALAVDAMNQGKLRDAYFSYLGPESENSPLGDGPRIAWIGIDYRELGVEPPSRLDNWSCELWSILQQGGYALGVDVVQMLKLEDDMPTSGEKSA